MIKLNISTMIYLPVNQVFDFVSRSENDFNWQYGILETAKLSEGISVMGTFFRSVGHFIGRRNLSTFEVIEYKKDSKYGFKSLSGPFHLQTSYTFEIVEGGTRLNVLTRVHAVNFFKVNKRSLGEKIKNETRENLEKLKVLLEAKASSLEIAPLTI